MFEMAVEEMQYLTDKLLNGLNPEQQSAVKATDGPFIIWRVPEVVKQEY